MQDMLIGAGIAEGSDIPVFSRKHMSKNAGMGQQELLSLLKNFDFSSREDDYCRIWSEVHSRGVPVIHIEGFSPGNQGCEVFERIGGILEKFSAPVIIDLSDCTYLSSMALGFIAKLAIRRRASNASVLLAGCKESVGKVISILNLGERLDICATLAEALTEAEKISEEK
jgi:anti-anti-sigma factor